MTAILSHLGCRFACAALTMALCLSVPASGQVERLPADLLGASQLTSEQEQQIEEFVKAQFARLKSENPTDVEEGRKSLEFPFDEREPPSFAFRLTFGRQVVIELGPVLRANDGDMDAGVNALLVAGKCGTPQTVELLGDVLAGRRGPVSPAMRAAAVAGLHIVIRDADAGRIRREQGEQAVASIAKALGGAENAFFASTCIIALRSTEREALHPKAAQELAAALPVLAASLRNAPKIEHPERWESVMQLGLLTIYMQILQAGGGQLDPTLAKASVEAGAQALGFAVTRFKDLGPSGLAGTDELANLVGLTDQAEKLMQLAGRSVAGFPTGLGAKLTEAVEQDDEAMFTDAVRGVARWVQRVTGKSADEYGF